MQDLRSRAFRRMEARAGIRLVSRRGSAYAPGTGAPQRVERPGESVFVRVIPSLAFLTVLALGFSASRARADEAPGVIPVIGRAVVPNAFQPALPCTLLLEPPGSLLRAPGLRVDAATLAQPDSAGEFSQLPFGPDDFTFDQVNVFWHAQRFLERLRTYGLDLEEFPIRVIVQTGIRASTHMTDPVSAIGAGENGLGAATKDGDVIVHEITHAVFNPRMPMHVHPLATHQTSATSEGLADYFAAAVHGDTRMGEYASPPNGTHDIASSPAVYRLSRWNSLPPDPYARGRVLNGALLAFRASVGEVADALVFQALAYRPWRCLPCFADAMRWADLDRNGGANLAALDAAFAERDIGTLSPTVIELRGRQTVMRGVRTTYQLTYGCGIGPFRTLWEQSLDNGASWATVGEGTDSLEVVADRTFRLRASVRDRRGLESERLVLPVRVLDPADPAYALGRVRIVGPSSLEVLQTARHALSFEGGRGVGRLQVTWSANGLTFKRLANPLEVQVTAVSDPAWLAAVCTDSLGQVSSDTLQIAVVPTLRTRVDGPPNASQAQRQWFTAVPSGGRPPYRHSWRQRAVSGPEEQLPSGSDVLNAPSLVSFELILTTVDSRNYYAEARSLVTVLPTVSGPGDAAPRRFRVLGSVVRRGEAVAFEIPVDSHPGELEILDVTGRVRTRVALPPEPSARFELPLPPDWEPGVYFARSPGRDAGRTPRFVVLR